jgi:hypothetical protein
MAFMPLAHTLFIVVQTTLSGSRQTLPPGVPALAPGWIESRIPSALHPHRWLNAGAFHRRFYGNGAELWCGNVFQAPPKLPIGVRTAETI